MYFFDDNFNTCKNIGIDIVFVTGSPRGPNNGMTEYEKTESGKGESGKTEFVYAESENTKSEKAESISLSPVDQVREYHVREGRDRKT